MPARSKSGLGIEAQARIPKNPAFVTKWIIFALNRLAIDFCSVTTELLRLVVPVISSANCGSISSSSSPASRWARATKYGGSSPKAVPAPHIKASRRTFDIIVQTLIDWTVPESGQTILKFFLEKNILILFYN